MPLLWKVPAAGAPPVRESLDPRPLRPGEVTVDVAGCLLEPRDARIAAGTESAARFALVPGRHSSGTVVAAGAEVESWIGQAVLVPELLVCGACPACRRALASACDALVQPGVRHDGGLSARLVVPARALIPLRGALEWKRPLAEAAAIGRFALAYQAIAMAGVAAGDVALAPDDDALRALLAAKGTRAPGLETPPVAWRVFVREGLSCPDDSLRPGTTVVAYGTPPVDWPLDALQRAEATVRFVSGCHPDLYPEIVALAIRGEIDVAVSERFPLSRGDEALARCAAGPVLVTRD